MANVLDIQISEEGPRNAVVKLTGVLDTGNISEVPAIAVQDFINNDQNLNLTGFRVDLIEYSIGPGIEVLLEWDGVQPQQIFPLAGRGRIGSLQYGGFVPDATRVGYNGNINLKTRNFTPGVDGNGEAVTQNFSVLLELVKLYA